MYANLLTKMITSLFITDFLRIYKTMFERNFTIKKHILSATRERKLLKITSFDERLSCILWQSFVYQFEVLDDRMSSHSFPWWSWVSSKPLAWIWIFSKIKTNKRDHLQETGFAYPANIFDWIDIFSSFKSTTRKHSNQIHHSRGLISWGWGCWLYVL